MLPFISGSSEKFQEAILQAELFSTSDFPVLLLGETGVGKEVLARFIHQTCARRHQPFVPVNCASIPSGLFESELFGYEKGAFSGAVQSYRGLIRSANQGVLFLDEIGELDLPLQAKLLRWFDSGEIRSVGSSRVEQTNVRVIAATNVDLHAAVAEKMFRLDLLERISVLTIEVPALRDRGGDILALAEHFLETMGAHFEKPDLEILTSFDWPGNIRQLRNVLARTVVLGRKRVAISILRREMAEEALRSSTLATQAHVAEDEPLEQTEKRIIIDRLRRFRGNRKRTAQALGIAKSTLHDKLRRWKEDSSMDSVVRLGG